MTREVPFLFSAPMVRALLDGRKTQTRRLAREADGDGGWKRLKVRAAVGDRIWVKETYRLPARFDALKPTDAGPGALVRYAADAQPIGKVFGKLRPSIHMPRWASRLTLEVTDVRAEWLQDISEADAIAEGVAPGAVYGGAAVSWLPTPEMRERFHDTARGAYLALWAAINPGGEANPLVWAYTFEVVKA